MNFSDINQSVGKQLRLRRMLLGLSQQALANTIKVSFQQVQKYESGFNAMNAIRLYEIGKALRVPVAYFFQELEHPKPLHHEEDHSISDRETLEIMTAYKRIKSPSIRKQLISLIRNVE